MSVICDNSRRRTSGRMMKSSTYLSGAQVTTIARLLQSCGLIGLGVLGLWYRDFALQWQPVPAGIPGRSVLACAKFTASMIPAWLPQRLALAYVTGAAHTAAGAGMLFGVMPRLAATLEAAMMGVFVALVHVPGILSEPTSRVQWTMLFVAVTLTGATTAAAATFVGEPNTQHLTWGSSI